MGQFWLAAVFGTVAATAFASAGTQAAAAQTAPIVNTIYEGSFQFKNSCDGSRAFNYLLRFELSASGDIVSEVIANFATAAPPATQPYLEWGTITFGANGIYTSTGYASTTETDPTGKWSGSFTNDNLGNHFTFTRQLSGNGRTCKETAVGTYGQVPSPAAF